MASNRQFAPGDRVMVTGPGNSTAGFCIEDYPLTGAEGTVESAHPNGRTVLVLIDRGPGAVGLLAEQLMPLSSRAHRQGR